MELWCSSLQNFKNRPRNHHTRQTRSLDGAGCCALALFARVRVLTSMLLSGRRERAHRNVISVRISERELLGLRVRIHVRLLFEPRDESACPLQRQVEIIDTEEQQEPVARCRVIGAYQGGMLVSAPRVEAEQNSSIGIEDLPKVIMGRKGSRLAEQRLIPFEADRHVAYPDDRPRALHPVPLCGL